MMTTITASPTGRLSTEGPNMQNIPMRTEEVRAIRKSVVDMFVDRETGEWRGHPTWGRKADD